MRYAFAGDRQISCNLLQFLIDQGHLPLALLTTAGPSSSHAEELSKVSRLDDTYILKGKDAIKEKTNIELLKSLNLDYIFGIHYPYIIPPELIDLPKIGFLNLHPAYLPFNKGWHTPSWAILEGKPYGATLHFMSEALDQGDIIHQKKIKAESSDTANSLYQKVLQLEEEVFMEAFDNLLSLNPKRIAQTEQGTSHFKKDLDKIREIDLNKNYSGQELLDKLRALSTNSPYELAYYKEGDKKIGVKVEFIKLDQ